MVITAIVMPTMDGLEVIKTLRAEAGKLAIIAVSPHGSIRSDLYLSLAKAMGADEVVAMTFGGAELVEAVERLL